MNTLALYILGNTLEMPSLFDFLSCLTHSLPLSIPLSLFLLLSLCLSLSLSLSAPLSLPLSLSLSAPLSLSLSLSLSMCKLKLKTSRWAFARAVSALLFMSSHRIHFVTLSLFFTLSTTLGHYWKLSANFEHESRVTISCYLNCVCEYCVRTIILQLLYCFGFLFNCTVLSSYVVSFFYKFVFYFFLVCIFGLCELSYVVLFMALRCTKA